MESRWFYLSKEKKGEVTTMLKRDPCPFVGDPFDDCYVSNMNTSSSIDAAVYYCGGNYRECNIYLLHTEPEEAGPDVVKQD
jgi:hypothetical protein